MKRSIFLGFLAFILVCILSCNSDPYTYAMIETDMGNMKVKLYNSTPIHRDNFIKLAKEGFYDDLLFHRNIKGFMIQGGDPDSKDAPQNKPLGMGGPGYTLEAEIGAPHIKGALSAARTGGPQNPEKRSSGSQFYLVQGTPQTDGQLNQNQQQKGIQYPAEIRELYKTIGGTPFLDMDYTVFGEVVEGLDIIDKIADAQTDSQNRPLQDIKMKISVLD